jgi:branched-chain amino acid transport system substrate-binding protein
VFVHSNPPCFLHIEGISTMKSLSIITALGLALVLTLSAPSVTLSQGPIKIGFMYVFSGRLAHYGNGAKQGATLAMDEINEAGGINGRKLEGIFGDTELKPDVGVKVATKLVKEDKVDVVMGIVSSAVASTVAPVMNSLETPLIITLAMTPDVTGDICNPYTFRVNMNGPQNIMGAAILASEMKQRKWTTVGPDYLFGYQCWEYFQNYLKQRKPDSAFAPKADTHFIPTTATDFSQSISKIMASDYQGVLISLYGGNLIDFIHQAEDKGFFTKDRAVLMNLAYSAEVMLGLGLAMPKGLWLGGLYWFQANSSPTNKKFVEAYRARYKYWPDYNAHGGYAGVKAYAAALQKAGSPDKKAVCKALEGLSLDLPVGPIVIRKGDHQAQTDGCWGVTDDFDPKLRCRVLKPMRIFKGEEITPPVEATGCKMKHLPE